MSSPWPLWERRTDLYERELKRIVSDWVREIELEEYGFADTQFALGLLAARLQQSATGRLRQAFQIGLNGRQITVHDEQVIQEALLSNSAFLSNSLSPWLSRDITRHEGSLQEIAEERKNRWRTRVGLYAGLFWVLIWQGMASAVVRQFGNQRTVTVPEVGVVAEPRGEVFVPQPLARIPVRRVLDPRARHCPTCPPKAGEFDSWEAMLLATGGLPADGSDFCKSNCRCRIMVRTEGRWAFRI